MVNYSFYAVLSPSGICTVNSDYKNCKAIFADRDEAERVLKNNPDLDIEVVEVNISKVES